MTSLIEAATRKKEKLRSIIRLFYEQPGEDSEAKSKIRKLPPPKGSGLPAHAVEDGGSSTADYEAFTVYAVRAWAALYDPRGGSWSNTVEAQEADVGIVIPQAYPEERVRIYRETMESYVTMRVTSGASGGVLLWDGSLRVVIGRHRPGAAERPLSEVEAEAARALLMKPGDVYGELWRLVNAAARGNALGEAPSRALLESALGGLASLRNEDGVWVAFLEWAEKVMAFRLLLEDAWRRGVTPIFVSKTSRSTSLLGRPLPDVYYLRMAEPVDPFVTPHRVLHGYREIMGFRGQVRGPFYPEHGGLEEFYRDRLGLAEFYVRLERGGPILKVEVAFDLTRVPGDGVEGLVEGVVSVLAGLPRASGYPYALRVAHSMSRLTRRDMERVLRALGLELEREARGMVEG